MVELKIASGRHPCVQVETHNGGVSLQLPNCGRSSSRTFPFSLCACLQKLVIEILLIFAGKSSGKFGGHFPGFFAPTTKEAHKSSGNFRSIFARNIITLKQSFASTSLCRRATLTFCTKNAMGLKSAMFYYRRHVALSGPICCRIFSQRQRFQSYCGTVSFYTAEAKRLPSFSTEKGPLGWVRQRSLHSNLYALKCASWELSALITSRNSLKGKKPHQKNTRPNKPNWKQFARTVCPNSFCAPAVCLM